MSQTIETNVIRAILNSDPVWSAYGLADLQPEFMRYCRWYPGQSEDGDGLALIFTALNPPVLLTVGADKAVVAALRRADLPPTVYISARDSHFAAIAAYYSFDEVRSMMRMALPPGRRGAAVSSTNGARAQEHADVVRLRRADAPAMKTLFAHGGAFTPDAFDPYQLDGGVFYGVPGATGEWLAVGGTHIVDWTTGVAAIGNMYTRPDCRGRGYAGMILAAIVAELQGRRVSNIVLNVDQRNQGAQRLYERHGFVKHCPFVEGIGVRHDG
jgi:GNAT superfamily N-acetyltransferase